MKSINVFWIFVAVAILSCSNPKPSLIKEASIGFNLTDSLYLVSTENVITRGIVFPDNNLQTDGHSVSTIKFQFAVNDSKEKLFYKIYFQNETYKFSEEDSLCYENFYGSWYDSTGFKEVTAQTVVDSFIIAGNPRFERRFFGAPLDSFFVNDERIQRIVHSIESTPEWKQSVEEKAKNNGMSFKEQAIMDALWTLKDMRQKGNVNHPWKRNPRMGKYSALLVVCTESALQQIPYYIQRIYQTNEQGKFVNPYQYFLFGDGKKIDGVSLFLDSSLVSLKLNISPGNGVFVDRAKMPATVSLANQSSCGAEKQLFEKALFEHFFSHENRSFKLATIPVLADWTKDEFSLIDYNRYKKLYADSNKRISSWIRNVDCACCYVRDSKDYLEIFNPASTSLANAAKVNVGVKTRIGITYGKITAKVKFDPMLNRHNIWHGITYAIWLITQDLHDWNNRRYSHSGYTPKGNPEGQRSHFTPYSEIDFEIIKTNPYWPYKYYKNKSKRQASETYDGTKDRNIVVALTNWDLASSDPKDFYAPLQTIKHQDKEYEAMRWSELYQALTIRTPVNHEEIFNREYYYFQIEWKPTEIIWRIGPEKNKLYEVGFMNYRNTSIPNNQMVLVINQEYHLAEWWPIPIYEQDFLPFLKNSVTGKIYEITVE